MKVIRGTSELKYEVQRVDASEILLACWLVKLQWKVNGKWKDREVHVPPCHEGNFCHEENKFACLGKG